MNVTLTNGVPVDLTTAIGAADTDEISVESNFETVKAVYLALAAAAPATIGEYDALLIPMENSPLCFRTVVGEAGLKLWAVVAPNPDLEGAIVRVNKV